MKKKMSVQGKLQSSDQIRGEYAAFLINTGTLTSAGTLVISPSVVKQMFELAEAASPVQEQEPEEEETE